MQTKTWLLKIFALIFIPLFFFALLELSFRLLGYQARGSYLKKVDRLVVLDNFYLDRDGIYKARPNFNWEPGVMINTDGFRSRPFSTPSFSNQTRIVIISDSFGWGYSAKPLASSFPDLLGADPRFAVFNLSIGGTGPEQYALVAAKYVPRLKPDICAVFVYLGNDINLSMAPTHLAPKKLIEKEWYVTNAGIIGAYDAEARKIIPPEVAYQKARTVAVRALNALRQTAVGTWLSNQLYNWVYRSRITNEAMRRAVNGELIESLQLINGVCRSNNAQMIVFPIPVNPLMENTRNSARDNRCLFAGFACHIITNLNVADYAPFPDDHFNNRGHLKMKKFIEQVLAKE